MLELLRTAGEFPSSVISAPTCSGPDWDAAEANGGCSTTRHGRWSRPCSISATSRDRQCYAAELCFLARTSPWTPVGSLPTPLPSRLLTAAKRLLEANKDRMSGADHQQPPPRPQSGRLRPREPPLLPLRHPRPDGPLRPPGPPPHHLVLPALPAAGRGAPHAPSNDYRRPVSYAATVLRRSFTMTPCAQQPPGVRPDRPDRPGTGAASGIGRATGVLFAQTGRLRALR